MILARETIRPSWDKNGVWTLARRWARVHLYVIKSPTVTGIMVYTKGKLVVEGGVETYYLMVSAKVAN
jgi:hypothetical protein